MKVLLIEDNPSDADLIKCQLGESSNFQVETATRLADAIKCLESKEYNVILLDLNLPDGLGLESLVRLRRHIQHIPIVVFTSLDNEQLGVMAIQRGAQDYLLKGADSSRVLQSLKYAIERMRARNTQEANEIAATQESARKQQDVITDRELEVLQLLRDGCTNLQIAEHLGISPTTVKSHITNILHKFAVTGRTKAVVEGLKRGLI